MPYSTQVPSPVRPDLGLASLVARAGHNAGYDIDLTLLDADRPPADPDRACCWPTGCWTAAVSGTSARPTGCPLLPKELIVPMGQGELPDELAELVRPFRRGAPLSPVAALRCERREFALRNGGGQTVALLRDDKVTVRRNGLTTARYREVMLTPVGPGLDAGAGRVAGPVPGQRAERHRDRALPPVGPPARCAGHRAVGPAGPGQPDRTAPSASSSPSCWGPASRDLIAADLALTGGAAGSRPTG